jgi:hypothetical protein
MMTERQATARWPRGDMPRVKPVPFLAGVQSPPLRGEGHPGQDGLAVESPEMTLRWFSRRGAVSAPVWPGSAQAGA